jgi:hypothetical protein
VLERKGLYIIGKYLSNNNAYFGTLLQKSWTTFMYLNNLSEEFVVSYMPA